MEQLKDEMILCIGGPLDGVRVWDQGRILKAPEIDLKVKLISEGLTPPQPQVDHKIVTYHKAVMCLEIFKDDIGFGNRNRWIYICAPHVQELYNQ